MYDHTLYHGRNIFYHCCLQALRRQKDGFKCVSQEFDDNVLGFVNKKGFHPYEYMSGFKKF